MLADGLDAHFAQDRVVRVPAEDLVGEEVEVLVDAEAAASKDLVGSDAVGLVRVTGNHVSADGRG